MGHKVDRIAILGPKALVSYMLDLECGLPACVRTEQT
jgi:hypothetical protein